MPAHIALQSKRLFVILHEFYYPGNQTEVPRDKTIWPGYCLPEKCIPVWRGSDIVKVKNKNINNQGNQGRLIHITDFDDLVFEHRNREYGAYQLRKRYNRVLLAGTIIASSLVILAVIIPFMIRPRNEIIMSGGGGYVQVRMENLPQPEEIYVPPVAPPPPEPAKIEEAVRYVPPVVVDSIIPIEQAPVSTDQILASAEGDLVDALGSGFGDELIPGMGPGTNDEPMFQVEVMPSFRGGDLSKFRDWVGNRTSYPKAAMENKIRGTVFLTFVVERDGSVSNVTIVKGVHPLLDSVAVKTISESPKWSPGLQRGQPVRVRFSIPLVFMF